jgi:pyruvate kinase
MVDVAENLLVEGGHVRPRDVVAIVAGTRTKSGSTNFLRLHVIGEQGARFFAPREEEAVSASAAVVPAPLPAKPAKKAPVKRT